MHLRLTEQELVTLVEMVHLASNAACWNHKTGVEEKLAGFEAVEKKLLEKARHSGLSDLIEWDEERQRWVLSEDYEEKSFAQECYDEFRNESFWEELVIRLADKGLMGRIGQAAWEELSEEQRRQKTAGLEKALWKEFSERGVENLMLIFPSEEG